MVHLDLREIGADESVDLRRSVLRDGRTDLPLAGDEHAYHLGLFDGDHLVATGNVVSEALEREPDVDAWRIHGMSTDEQYRGVGAGGRILEGLLQHVEAQGGVLAWCHARVGARRFYERHGFTTYGDVFFMPPPWGPHVEMTRVVGPTPT